MSADGYHDHPALSSSGARKLLPPSCPARFRWERDNPPPPRAIFDFGHAAHRFVLGKGEDIVRIDAPDWRTKDAKEKRDDARAMGLVPVLAADYDAAQAMADVLHADSLAAPLFTDGEPEVARFWTDPETGTDLRTRFDWLPSLYAGGPIVVPEYKTAVSAEPGEFRRAAARYGYHQQAAWYLDTLAAEGVEDARFVFVVQEKTPPYLVTVVELDVMALQIGRHRNRQAIDLYARCVADDHWPGYADDVVSVSLPAWAEAEYLDDVAPADIEVV